MEAIDGGGGLGSRTMLVLQRLLHKVQAQNGHVVRDPRQQRQHLLDPVNVSMGDEGHEVDAC